MYLTNSEMSCWRRCKRKWWLQNYRKLRKVDDTNFNKPLGIGNRVHDALAAYYDPESRTDPLEFVAKTTQIDLDTYPEYVDDIRKEYSLAHAMLEGYLEWLAETGEDQAMTVIETERGRSARLEPNRDVFLLTKLDARVQHDEYGTRLALEHKGQPLDAMIMTPSGPRAMGSLQVGDFVIGSDGAPTEVVGVYPLGEQPMARVTFTDGSSVLTTWDHAWSVSIGVKDKPVVRTTHQLSKLGPRKIQRVRPVQFDEQELPIPPYTMGVLLGDGSIVSKATLSTADREIVDSVREDVQDVVINLDAPRAPGLKAIYQLRLPEYVTYWLAKWELLGCRAYEKFIPSMYLLGSIDQRWALLQGLMDSDGSVGPQVRFVSTSKALIDGVQFLVESFGGTMKIHSAEGRVGTMASGYNTRTHWYGTVQGLVDLHRVERKQIYRDQQLARGRRIASIVQDDTMDAQCIRVAATDQLYVTEHFIVTHNTVGSLKQHLPELQVNTQCLTEHLTEFLALIEEGQDAEAAQAQGVLFNMLLKSKRTPRAAGPFYKRFHVRHSTQQLRNHWWHVVAIADEIEDAREKLDAGGDHHVVCHPNPAATCHWDCEFFHSCAMIDTNDDHEGYLTSRFEVGDPLARYRGLLAETVESSSE